MSRTNLDTGTVGGPSHGGANKHHPGGNDGVSRHMVSVSRIQPVSCNLRIALEMAAQPTALRFCKLLGVKLYQRVDLEPI